MANESTAACTTRLATAIADIALTEEPIFPFFDPPRELRDTVYAHLLGPSTELTRCASVTVTLSASYLLPCRLVNHRFENEYANEVARQAHAEIVTVGNDWDDVQLAFDTWPSTHSQLPRTLSSATWLHRITWSEPTNPLEYFRHAPDQIAWIAAQLPTIRQLDQNLKIERSFLEDGFMDNDKFDPAEFFRDAHTATPASNSSGASITYDRTLLIQDNLYTVNEDALDEHQDLVDALADSPLNYILYTATPHKHGESCCGLELEVVEAGRFDLDAAFAAANEQREEDERLTNYLDDFADSDEGSYTFSESEESYENAFQ